MLVKINRYKFGGFTFKPVNRKTVKQYHKNMVENGCNLNNLHFDLLLNYDDINDLVSRAKFKDLDEGYTITVQVDPWIVRHYFGYYSE